MRKFLKLIGFLSGTLVLFFVVAVLAFYHLVRIGEFRRFLVYEIEKNTELKLQIGAADLEFGWITGLVFQNVTLSEPDSAQPALTAERVTARVALRPLLRRQVIFYEVHLSRPTARFTRDRSGRIEVLDRLLNLPFLKQQNGDFTLDLRSVKVDGADVDLSDSAPNGLQWRLINGRLEIERLRGARLRALFQEFVKRGRQEFPGLPLAFNMDGLIVKQNAKINLKSRGYLVLPRQEFDLQQARWNADVELVDFPAALVRDYIGEKAPIKAMAGHLAERVHIEGNPAQQLRLRGDVEFKQLAVDAPELFLTALDRLDGRMSFEIERSPEHWQLRRVDFRTNDLHFSVQGDIAAPSGRDPRLRLNLSPFSAPVPVLRKYLPLKLITAPSLKRIVDAVDTGELQINKAGLDGTFAELREVGQGRIGKGVWLDAEVRDLAGKLPGDNGVSVRSVAGRVNLANHVLGFHNVRGSYGDTRLIDVDGTYDVSSENGGKLDLHARADVNLAQLKEQLRSAGIAPQVSKFLSSLEELSGRSRIDLTLQRALDAPLQFAGKMTLDQVRARYNEYILNDLQGELAFAPQEISGEKIRAQLNGSPIQIRLALKDYGTDAGTFDLGIESSGIRAGVLTTLLLDSGSPRDAGLVRGAVRYAGSFGNKTQRKFTGNLELVNVQMMVQPLLQPLRQLNGRINIDESGIEFQHLDASLVGFPASVSGRWRYRQKPQLLFDFAAPNLDITYLISQIDPESSDFYASLVAEGKITLNKGRIKNFEFSDLKTNASIDHRVWRLTNLAGRSAGGAIQGVTTIFDKPDTIEVIANPRIQSVPIQSFLNWFNVNTTEMTGKVNLTGQLETVGKNDTERKQNLNGAFNLRIEDGTIHRMRLLVQLLNLLDLSRWFSFQMPDLAKQGIRFRAISGDFKVTNGVYSTENLIVDSNDLRMTGIGKIDVPNDHLNFLIAVRPFAGIDTAISYIPLLGRSIAAIKNSLLVASFNITGSIDDPTITPAPLGTLSEWFWGVLGIPKNIIGFGEAEKKEATNPPIEAPVP